MTTLNDLRNAIIAEIKSEQDDKAMSMRQLSSKVKESAIRLAKQHQRASKIFEQSNKELEGKVLVIV
jgi:hypothetical protein